MEPSINILREKLRSGLRSDQFHKVEHDNVFVESLLSKIWRQSNLSSVDFNLELLNAWDTRGDSKLSVPQLDDNGNLYRVILELNQQLDPEKKDEPTFDSSQYNILGQLPYEIFLQTIIDNDIRGKDLMSLCVSNPEINQKIKLLQIEHQIESSQIENDPNPRETYFELSQSTVWTFGNGTDGQLGLGDLNNRSVPTRIPNITKVKQISCGGLHSAFIDQKGGVWTFGRGNDGRLGLGDDGQLDSDEEDEDGNWNEDWDRMAPTRIPNIPKVKQISCGGFHTGFIDQEGGVWIFGDGRVGQLGLGDYDSRLVPTQIPHIPKAKQISCGNQHTAFIDQSDQVWTFGLGYHGQLGLGNRNNQLVPTQILGIPKAKQISCGAYHTSFIDLEGGVWTFGAGDDGQLGLGDQNNRSVPTQIPNAPKAKQISCGNFHTAFIDQSDQVWTFGHGDYGQLGLGDLNKRSVPTQIPDIPKVKQISCGAIHTAFIDQEGEVWIFGRGDFGQLGLGDQNDRSIPTPTRILNIPKVKEISCGDSHTAFIA